MAEQQITGQKTSSEQITDKKTTEEQITENKTTEEQITEKIKNFVFSKFDPILAPSIICADPWDIKTYLEEFDKAGIKLIHFDVMDGQFVPNISLGTGLFSAIHRASDIPLDLHLMTLHPEKTFTYFDVREGDHVCFHPETCSGTYSLLSAIRKKGCKAGIALCPATPLDVVREVSEVLDFVLMMAVEPGFSGQKMLPNHLDKAARLDALRYEIGASFKIQVDGDACAENVQKNLVCGVDDFVNGSSMVGGNFVAANFAEDYVNFRKKVGLKV